jgi:ABC-type dipeptide/oligopeptide/nickel transport system permease component
MRYSFFLRRLLSAIPVMFIITFATFVLMQMLPGGPLAAYENNPEISQEDIQRLRHEMGLDRPIPVQYWAWLKNFVRGDWGYSFVTKRPVLQEIWDRLPNTLYLTGFSLILALIIAIPAGIISATRQYSIFDHITTTLTYIGRSMPVYYSGLLLIIIFSIWLRWFPSGGMHTLGKDFSTYTGKRFFHHRQPAPFVSAGAQPVDPDRRQICSLFANQHARSDSSGLHSNCGGQGIAQPHHHLQACLSKRGHSPGDSGRH